LILRSAEGKNAGMNTPTKNKQKNPIQKLQQLFHGLSFDHFFIALFSIVILTSNGCSKKNGGAESSDVLRFRLPTDPPSLDWNLATDNVSKEVLEFFHGGLVRHNGEAATVDAELAESWTISKDGKTYTFKLREGLVWSDGKPLVASHFVDSWERLLNSTSGAEYSYFLFDIVGAEDYNAKKINDFSQVGVKAIDDRTLEVKLRAPVAYWIYVPAFWPTYPFRKDIFETHKDKWNDPANFVSAGPYVLKEYLRDSKVLLTKNMSHWNKEALKTMPSAIEFRIVKDDASAVSHFKNGGFDILRDLPPIQVQVLSKLPQFKALPFLRGYYIGFNITDPSVKDIKIRKALSHAIDRTELERVLGPMITASHTWNHPSLIGYNKDRGLKTDIELAKKLWSEVKDKPKTIELSFDQKELNKLVAENVQAQWKRVLGLDVNLTSSEWKVYIKGLRVKSPAAWRMGWGADYPDPQTFFDLFTCKSGNNFTGMCDANYDKLIVKAGTGKDNTSRSADYDQIEKILLEDQVAILPLFSQTNMYLVSDRLQGFSANPMAYHSIYRLKINK
jgi:oligopeptide transport system substrate-binding protein